MISNLMSVEKITNFLNRVVDISHTNLESDLVSLNDYIEVWKEIPLNSGDVVIIMLPNSKCALQNFFSICLLGFIPLIIPFTTPVKQLNNICKNLNVSAIITSSNLHLIKELDNEWNIKHNENQWIIWYHTFRKPFLISNPSIILATSGTSGPSSGCLFDVSKLLENAKKHAVAIGLKSHDITLINLPLCYSYALIAQALASYVSGGILVISSPPFNSETYQKNIDIYQITTSSLTPFLVNKILENNPSVFSKLNKLTVGGGKLPCEHINNIASSAKNLEFYITYGLTEAGPRVSTLPIHLTSKHKWGSVGLTLPGTEILIHHDELYIHSDTLLNARVGKNSKNTFLVINEKKWLITGDLFKYDDDGYLYYHGRNSDFEIIKGEKIHLPSIKEFCNSLNEISYSDIKIQKGIGTSKYILKVYLKNEYDLPKSDKIKRNIMLNLRPAERPEEIHVMFEQVNNIKYK